MEPQYPGHPNEKVILQEPGSSNVLMTLKPMFKMSFLNVSIYRAELYFNVKLQF